MNHTITQVIDLSDDEDDELTRQQEKEKITQRIETFVTSEVDGDVWSKRSSQHQAEFKDNAFRMLKLLAMPPSKTPEQITMALHTLFNQLVSYSLFSATSSVPSTPTIISSSSSSVVGSQQEAVSPTHNKHYNLVLPSMDLIAQCNTLLTSNWFSSVRDIVCKLHAFCSQNIEKEVGWQTTINNADSILRKWLKRTPMRKSNLKRFEVLMTSFLKQEQELKKANAAAYKKGSITKKRKQHQYDKSDEENKTETEDDDKEQEEKEEKQQQQSTSTSTKLNFDQELLQRCNKEYKITSGTDRSKGNSWAKLTREVLTHMASHHLKFKHEWFYKDPSNQPRTFSNANNYILQYVKAATSNHLKQQAQVDSIELALKSWFTEKDLQITKKQSTETNVKRRRLFQFHVQAEEDNDGGEAQQMEKEQDNGDSYMDEGLPKMEDKPEKEPEKSRMAENDAADLPPLVSPPPPVVLSVPEPESLPKEEKPEERKKEEKQIMTAAEYLRALAHKEQTLAAIREAETKLNEKLAHKSELSSELRQEQSQLDAYLALLNRAV